MAVTVHDEDEPEGVGASLNFFLNFSYLNIYLAVRAEWSALAVSLDAPLPTPPDFLLAKKHRQKPAKKQRATFGGF